MKTVIDELKANFNLWEAVFCFVLLGAIIFLICVPKPPTKYDLVLSAAQGYIAQPTKENLVSLEHSLNVCYQDGEESSILSLKIDCSLSINSDDLDSNSIFPILFNSLVRKQEIEFIKKYYFTYSLDYSTPPGGRYALHTDFQNFLSTYDGKDLFLLRLKARSFTDRPRASYNTYVKAFFLTTDLEIRREIADRIRGILVQFDCTNEMRAWERYSAVEFRGYSDSFQQPLAIEAVNKMQEFVESGFAPELSSACRLKEYKL